MLIHRIATVALLALTACADLELEPATPLLGDANVETSTDHHEPGLADASLFLASSDGMVNTLTVYHEDGDVNRLLVGLYDDQGGHPSALLTTGTILLPVTHAWNTVIVPPVPVKSGARYWIALVAPLKSGTAFSFQYVYHDQPDYLFTEHSAEANLTSMPATWKFGAPFPHTTCSFYAGP